ncbi:uncharacterized protein Z519_01392 [Cladophialophora bantiana CBS 173.52]|uniref:histone deacetylase n=1 Tax=Cladophialophora bantiana (strain ATCC 10958 / CBS 173.52 / CDC B-1940 / NIH 8579) TaxID=1442370 RepID=A0A0D2HWQ5_CLAB1|nr:uncharacterized protein Z519_01392 [Cladophialophora bantiana CBS 173.52]KIW97808.1 hypothetical protein Z519_01392 [Cladophialophora bantiana CBS 173.52]
MAQIPLPDQERLYHSSDGARFPNPVPRVLEPNYLSGDTSMRETPDVSADIDHRLKIESPSEEDYEDSLLSDTSSEAVEPVLQSKRGLPISQLPTGLCYDERMRYHAEVSATTRESVHPEDPRRIYYIYKELCEAGLVDDKKHPPIVEMPLYRIHAREATEDECLLVHAKYEYEMVKSTASMSDEELIDLSELREMDSIYFNQLSFFSAKLSTGAAIETCRAVMSRKVKNAIAVIRPPGHHAEIGKAMGFCLFNNVSVASRVCQKDFGEDCRKILILDWSVAFRNGCQQVFYEDPNVLYISLHVYMNGKFYPEGPQGDMYHCGTGAGEGKNVNIPWPSKGMGDGDYMYAFQNVVMPIANEFDPDFVIIAAGFDAAAGDELGGCFVTPPCYAHMTHMLMSLAGGRIAVCLEGGYNFGAISKSALAVTRTLMGEPPDRLQATSATQSAVDTVAKVRNVQSKYWRSIYPKDPVSGIFGGERLHDILRQYQAMHLYDSYKFTPLHIYRDTVSKSFDRQVLATPNYESKKALMIIFHDSPDLLSSSNGLSTQQKPHDTWLVDGTQSYVQWAVSMGMGVIDINMPEFITLPDDVAMKSEYGEPTDIEYASTTTDLARKEGEKLAFYLWENYIEPYDFPWGIVLMGAGHAFHAIAKLVSENERVYSNLVGIVCFISTQPIRPISNPGGNHWVSQWYRENSLVFVSAKHSLWKKEKEGGRVSKRYGRLVRSEEEVLNQIMMKHKKQVCQWIFEKISQRREEMGGSTEEEEEEEEEEAGDEDSMAAVAGDEPPERGDRDSDADTIDDPTSMEAESGDAGARAAQLGEQPVNPSTSVAGNGEEAAVGFSNATPPAEASTAATDHPAFPSGGGGDVLMTTEP